MTDRRDWPQWLKVADTVDANVEVNPATGRVVWHGGEWRGGEWRGGEWRGGEWRGGEWRGGEWRGGVWLAGVWHGGIWHGGVWLAGVWRGGEWRGGVWLAGVWHGGIWHGGEWRGGIWHGGEWRGGEWRGGVWRGGEWQSGWSTCTRAPWTVLSNGAGSIRFGCKLFSLTRAQAIAAGDVRPPEEAPAVGSREAQMLRASLAAQIEYDRVMAEWVEV